MTRKISGLPAGIPICGNLGDQQAALVGQGCFEPGDCKNTYGTGCFMLLNTGNKPVTSRCGLLTTVGYRFGDGPAVYALEGSIAVTGALVQWLRDNLGMIAASNDIEPLAAKAADNGGVYFVPAFSGLFVPRWRSDARGTIVGMTRFTDRSHIARAALEASAYQTRDVLEAMRNDAGLKLSTLKVDGGMTANELLMQFQADVLGIAVVRPKVMETTALGAAYAAARGPARGRRSRRCRPRVAGRPGGRRWTARPAIGFTSAGWQRSSDRLAGWMLKVRPVAEKAGSDRLRRPPSVRLRDAA